MPSVASTHPLWGAVLRSLREMTRLAVVALALASGVGGATAASAAPPAAISEVARPIVPAASHSLAALRPDRTYGATVTQLLVRDAPMGASQAAAGAVAAALRHVRDAVTNAPIAEGDVRPVVEPTGSAATRRGPPSA